jgi:hypothetical protein
MKKPPQRAATLHKLLISLATPAGLEPATCRLEGGCSIQLSYGAGRTLRRSGELTFLLRKHLALRNYLQVKSDERAGSVGPLFATGRFEIIGIA